MSITEEKKMLTLSGRGVTLGGEYAEYLIDELSKRGVSAQIADYDGEYTVIGNTECASDAVAAARAELCKIERSSYFAPRYAVYNKRGCIAFVYDDNEYTDLKGGKIAISSFLAEHLSDGEIKVGEGLIASGVIDLYPIQREIDGEYKAGYWKRLGEALTEKYGKDFGDRLYESFEVYYKIFKDELVEWYANLYEPSIGGFYAATSGKEHFGFLPLVESTAQGLGHLESFGVFPDRWYKCLPRTVIHKIGYFIKSCQDPNGFFYHPQMVKAVTDGSLNSRGRNLWRAIGVLKNLGMKPTYPTQRGDEYDGLSADEWWDGMVESGEISPDEVRPFVPKSLYDYERWLEGKPTFKTKDEAMEHEKQPETVSGKPAPQSTAQSNAYLESHKGFSDYLDTKNIDAQPYSCASELNGTYHLIKAASERLGKCEESGFWYSGMTLCEMTIDWLNRHINSKGLFGSCDESSDDPFEGVRYANTNGLMKAIPIYNDWDVVYPEPLKAARGCLVGITSPEPSIKNICETYNIWSAFSGLMDNVKRLASEEDREKTLREVRLALCEIGPDAVRNTYNKQSKYQKASGGFSHNIYQSSVGYQGGVWISLKGLNEANVDANGFGSASVISAMLTCFEMREYMPPMYTTYNYMRFIDTMLGLEPCVKKRAPEELLPWN